MFPSSLLTLETARRRTLGIRAVIKHSPRHNGSLPTHALTLGELAHNITPGGREFCRKVEDEGSVWIYNITPGQLEHRVKESCMKSHLKCYRKGRLPPCSSLFFSSSEIFQMAINPTLIFGKLYCAFWGEFFWQKSAICFKRFELGSDRDGRWDR